jgi:hypothetical protein
MLSTFAPCPIAQSIPAMMRGNNLAALDHDPARKRGAWSNSKVAPVDGATRNGSRGVSPVVAGVERRRIRNHLPAEEVELGKTSNCTSQTGMCPINTRVEMCHYHSFSRETLIPHAWDVDCQKAPSPG